MLPPFIIEQIRKREEEERAQQGDQPRLELPLVPPGTRRRIVTEDEGDPPERGVVVIDLGG